MNLSLQLKRHDRFSNFHVIVRKKLAFVLKLHSFGLSLTMLHDPLKYQNSKFGHSATIQETMVTKQTDIHCNNLYAAWWVWCENALKHTYERTVLDLKIPGWRMTCLCKWPSLPIPIKCKMWECVHVGVQSHGQCCVEKLVLENGADVPQEAEKRTKRNTHWFSRFWSQAPLSPILTLLSFRALRDLVKSNCFI